MKFRKFIYRFISYSIIFILITACFINDSEAKIYGEGETAAWPSYPSIYAESGVLIEASTGTVLYNKNAHDKMYPASITKIMTTLLALENGNLSDMVEFYHYDVYSLELGDAHIARQEGELLSLKDALYAVMLASANEVANAVGEYVARKNQAYTDKIASLKASNEEYDESKVAISVFADMMNNRAKEAGALGTHFSNPNGLFDENHYTTCYDMAMITRAAAQNDDFLKIESNTTYTIPATNKQSEPYPMVNRHKMMLPSYDVYYEGILGGKTGYVDQSGTTLVTIAKRNGMTLISVVMKTNGANVYNDTKLLLDYGFNNFSLSNVFENENKFSINNSTSYSNLDTVFGTNIPLIQLGTDGFVVLPNGVSLTDCKSELSFLDSSELTDNKIAKINYYYNNINVGGTSLLLNSNNEDNSFEFGPKKDNSSTKKNKKKIFININIWIVLIILIIIIAAILIIRYTKTIQNFNRSRRRRLRRLRQRRKASKRRKFR